MKFKKGDLVQSYSDETTRGIIKYYDKEEGAWLVKLTTGTLNLVFFQEDEPIFIFQK